MLKLLGAILVVAVAWACWPASTLPMESLPKYRGSTPDGAAWVGGRCNRSKCLTIYVAPWCGVCVQMQGTIVTLRKDLEAHGIPVHIVIGMDQPAALIRYAESFPQTVTLDDKGAFQGKAKIRAVPYFAVTNGKGKIEEDLYGGFNDVQAMRSKLGI